MKEKDLQWAVLREFDEDGLNLCEFYGPFKNEEIAYLYALEMAKYKRGTFSPMPLMKPYKMVQAMCCIHPPGDGSTCAGGSCCCTENYKCDLCKTRSGEE